MTQPLSLDTVLSEFSEDSPAWVLQSKKGGRYLTVPDDSYPGRRPIHFFMSKSDAERFLSVVLGANPSLALQGIAPSEVKLLAALRGIAADKSSGNADSFVVHSQNEVYEFMQGRAP
jgi:hypothetical protein